jgi:hypothetical protein
VAKYLSVAACALAFVLAMGIKWNPIADPKGSKTEDTEAGEEKSET